MKTTLDLDDELLDEVMQAYRFRYKTEAIEEGLRELLARKKREQLAALFGTDSLKTIRRRR